MNAEAGRLFPSPSPVHFKGSADGAVFEDSREAGEPYEFTVGQAKLRGFDEAVQGLAVGETKEVNTPVAPVGVISGDCQPSHAAPLSVPGPGHPV